MNRFDTFQFCLRFLQLGFKIHVQLLHISYDLKTHSKYQNPLIGQKRAFIIQRSERVLVVAK